MKEYSNEIIVFRRDDTLVVFESKKEYMKAAKEPRNSDKQILFFTRDHMAVDITKDGELVLSAVDTAFRKLHDRNVFKREESRSETMTVK